MELQYLRLHQNFTFPTYLVVLSLPTNPTLHSMIFIQEDGMRCVGTRGKNSITENAGIDGNGKTIYSSMLTVSSGVGPYIYLRV